MEMEWPPEWTALALAVVEQTIEDLKAGGELAEAATVWIDEAGEGFGFWAGVLRVDSEYLRELIYKGVAG